MPLPFRLRRDPVKTLTWIEFGAVVLTSGADLFRVVVASPYGAMVDPIPYIVAAATVVVTAGAIFAIPHSPNRRFFAIAVAIAGIGALGWLPPHGNIVVALAAVLAARLTLAFGIRGSAIAWGAVLVAIVLDTVEQARGSAYASEFALAAYLIFSNALLFALVFGMIAMMAIYAKTTAESAASAERARIALDLHDSLGHGLTTLSVHLENADLLHTTNPQKANAYVKRAAESVAGLLADVRDTVAILHDDVKAAPAPFQTLLDRLHSEFLSTHDCDVQWSVQLAHELSGRVTIALYRVLQEALTNVARHAGATRVRVAIFDTKGAIELRVEDNGRGFSGDPLGRHGLVSMRSRIESVGGDISITSHAGVGTVVFVLVPLEAGA